MKVMQDRQGNTIFEALDSYCQAPEKLPVDEINPWLICCYLD